MSERNHQAMAATRHLQHRRMVLYLVIVSPTAYEVERADEWPELWHEAAARTYLYRSSNRRLRSRVRNEMLTGHPVDVYGIDLQGGTVEPIQITVADREGNGHD